MTVNESGGSDSFNVIESGGELEYSINGGAFSANWGGPGNIVNASSLTTVFINLGADNSAIILGSPTSAASNNFALFNLSAFAGNTNDSLTINDGARSLSGGTYSVNTSTHTIIGPASGINVAESRHALRRRNVPRGQRCKQHAQLQCGRSHTDRYEHHRAECRSPTTSTLDALNFEFYQHQRRPCAHDHSRPGPHDQQYRRLDLHERDARHVHDAAGNDHHPPAGLPASDFTATINWGDGSPVSAATIVQDAANPSVYDITGNALLLRARDVHCDQLGCLLRRNNLRQCGWLDRVGHLSDGRPDGRQSGHDCQ